MDIKIIQQLSSDIDRILPDIAEIRHTIHQNPYLRRNQTISTFFSVIK
jgi:hypothetical protein